MEKSKLSERWLRGPLPSIPALLQPIAHALLQAKDEVNSIMKDFPEELLWLQVAGLASPAFHLQHMKGVIDRLFTYAMESQLNYDQLTYLAEEGKPTTKLYTLSLLIKSFNDQIDTAIKELSNVDENTLTKHCEVGRKKLPSTAIGLYVHAAEHIMRHVGQLLVTVKISREMNTISL
ncbi:DinB family protein [Mucilaginibacter segetis]|uniref:DinB family protein n=1 Tax=Mucilaginibacter segetis TaxID=2793071 RepID=A0A934PU62_9SPHI|nr:DinB family protein [Mucilaginibacter segetis]MBK0379145.1 DinB family protein [Mucilaginibacter segetis]